MNTYERDCVTDPANTERQEATQCHGRDGIMSARVSLYVRYGTWDREHNTHGTENLTLRKANLKLENVTLHWRQVTSCWRQVSSHCEKVT